MTHNASQIIIVSLMLIGQSNRYAALLHPEEESVKLVSAPRRNARIWNESRDEWRTLSFAR